MIKKWAHIPRCGTLAIVHSEHGLNIKSLFHLYKESHAIAHTSSRLKADATVNSALDSKIARESNWTHKKSTSVESEDMFNKAITNISPSKITISSTKSAVKKSINEEIQSTWSQHIKSLTVQGKYLDLLSMEKSDITWKSIMYNLPRGILRFAINACIDTLPTHANLRRWGRKSDGKCKLCGNRETLHHSLNNCKIMLEQGRYTWRHNSIVNYITCLSSNFETHVDLPGKLKGASTIPSDIFVTNLKPDVILIDRDAMEMIIIEISVPFEDNIEKAHSYKSTKYNTLICDLENEGLKVNYFAIEIGSRGYISKSNVNHIKCLLKKIDSNEKFSTVKSNLCKISLLCSYVIFYSKFDNAWNEPKLVEL